MIHLAEGHQLVKQIYATHMIVVLAQCWAWNLHIVVLLLVPVAKQRHGLHCCMCRGQMNCWIIQPVHHVNATLLLDAMSPLHLCQLSSILSRIYSHIVDLSVWYHRTIYPNSAWCDSQFLWPIQPISRHLHQTHFNKMPTYCSTSLLLIVKLLPACVVYKFVCSAICFLGSSVKYILKYWHMLETTTRGLLLLYYTIPMPYTPWYYIAC